MRVSYRRATEFAACLVIALTGATGIAQAQTAELTGRVRDSQQGAVRDAIVIALNEATSVVREARTDDSGLYRMPSLLPGRYQVTVSFTGFQSVTRSGISLVVGERIEVDFSLQPSTLEETITVTAEPSRLSTSAVVATVVDRQFVENMPLNGRSFQSLIALTPGVVIAASGLTNTAGQFSVNGQRAGSNSFMVDGVSANFSAAPGNFGAQDSSGNLPGLSTFGTTQSLVSVDALQEFKVQTSSYSAQYGRQPGGQISIATRSGTNQLHGTVFDYFRNDTLDANDWFANRAGVPKPPQRQNDFGGTAGGPVRLPSLYDGRNRTFFFASYEGLRLRQPQFNLTNVPTMALRQSAPAGMQAILNAFPQPNGRDLGNGLAEFTGSYSDPSSLDAASLRIDHSLSRRLSMFGRYHRARSGSEIRRANIDLASISVTNLLTQTLTVGLTFSKSTGATNQLTVNFSDNDGVAGIVLDDFGGAMPAPRSVLVPASLDSPAARGSLNLLFPIRTATSNPNLSYFDNFISAQRQVNIVDTFSFSFGAHRIVTGFDYRHLAPTLASNSYFINGSFATQQEVLNGIVPGASVTQSLPTKPRFMNFSAFLQDTIRVGSRITLDVGARWDVNPPPSEANGNSPLAVDQIDNYATIRLAPAGTRLWKTRLGNVAPRLGASYQLNNTPGRDSVLRGGVGLFYDAGNDILQRTFVFFPYLVSRNVTNVALPLDPAQVAPPPLPNMSNPTPPYGTFGIFDPNLRAPYTVQWNVALEQSIGRHQSVTVSYVGASGKRLLQANQATISTLNPLFTTIQPVDNGADSEYRALQTQFQRRLTRGLQVLGAYTWSRAIDTDSTGSTLRKPQRGYANFDVRHVGTAAATYAIPGAVSNRVARALLSRWSLDAKLTMQSALPVDVVASTVPDPATNDVTNVRPNIVPGVPLYLDDATAPGGRVINRAAFTIPAAGTSGNLGRNQLRGFPLKQIDFAVHREFPLAGQARLQFRAEAFNVLNTPNFGAIQTALTATNFGQATNIMNRQLGGISQLYQAGGPRSVQLALKVLY